MKQFHLQQNAQAYVPRVEQRAAVAEAIRSIFNSPDRPSAEVRLKVIVAQYQQSALQLSAWMEENRMRVLERIKVQREGSKDPNF